MAVKRLMQNPTPLFVLIRVQMLMDFSPQLSHFLFPLLDINHKIWQHFPIKRLKFSSRLP